MPYQRKPGRAGSGHANGATTTPISPDPLGADRANTDLTAGLRGPLDVDELESAIAWICQREPDWLRTYPGGWRDFTFAIAYAITHWPDLEARLREIWEKYSRAVRPDEDPAKWEDCLEDPRRGCREDAGAGEQGRHRPRGQNDLRQGRGARVAAAGPGGRGQVAARPRLRLAGARAPGRERAEQAVPAAAPPAADPGRRRGGARGDPGPPPVGRAERPRGRRDGSARARRCGAGRAPHRADLAVLHRHRRVRGPQELGRPLDLEGHPGRRQADPRPARGRPVTRAGRSRAVAGRR